MKMSKISIACAFLMVVSVSFGGYVTDDFTGGTQGSDINGNDGWSAPSGVIYSNSAMYLPSSSGATNAVNESPGSAWTDFDITPALGIGPSSPPTNTASTLFYFDATGNIVIWDDAWVTCTNDVWGNTVSPISAGDNVRISIYQNYAKDTFALFRNERCLVQDVDFPSGDQSTYTSFAIQNADSNAVVDYVRVQTSAYTASSNNNHNAVADITEMNNNGYVARTLYVPGTGTQPSFSTIQLAADAARDGDQISVASGSYAENVTVTNAIAFVGSAFTINGLTINDDVTFGTNVTATTLTVGNNATITTGYNITNTTLNMVAGTYIKVTTGVFHNNALSMDGTFTIDGGNWHDWGGSGILAQSLPFSDDFDSYANNSSITNYGLYGWGASSNTVVVQSSESYSGKALYLPDGTMASNKIDHATGAVWVEYFIRPALGAQPSSSDATEKSFMSYVNTNGNMVIYDGSAWSECANVLGSSGDFNGPAPTPLASNQFRRVAIYEDFTAAKCALFIDSGDNANLQLVAQKVPFPGTQASLNSFVIKNSDNKAYIDNITISTTRPTGFDDLDGDGMNDGEEISINGSTLIYPNGKKTIFKFI